MKGSLFLAAPRPDPDEDAELCFACRWSSAIVRERWHGSCGPLSTVPPCQVLADGTRRPDHLSSHFSRGWERACRQNICSQPRVCWKRRTRPEPTAISRRSSNGSRTSLVAKRLNVADTPIRETHLAFRCADYSSPPCRLRIALRYCRSRRPCGTGLPA